ncbi:hypothetical protein [Micromonospora sp. NPDC049679]|uniref:hypothetical protein n=1 Tax=Micromonospora sp. NPDC049679 TaxID=3155920 RepID=UPI0033D0C136
MLVRYPGLSPSNAPKDAKYSVVHGPSGRMEVRLIYRVSDREKQLLTTDRHDRLVEMVNMVKQELNGFPGGSFYINEYRDVLVPDRDGAYFAGTYNEFLKFDYDGKEITPVPPPDLAPGDPWVGPHVGIHYVLKVDGNIKYEVASGRARIEHRLSDYVGPGPARLLAKRLGSIKGQAGGGIYINEACAFFARVHAGGGNWAYLYLGQLEDDAWFPAPDVPGRH